jgi:hypothetical protein
VDSGLRALRYSATNQCQDPPAAVLVQHPIYQPTKTKAALSDFTTVMALLEGMLLLLPAQYPSGAAMT